MKSQFLDTSIINHKEYIDPGAEYIAPRSSFESNLRAIYAKVLKLKCSQVGVANSFFAIGGNSENVKDLINLINKEFGSSICIADVYRHNYVASLVSVVLESSASYIALAPLNNFNTQLIKQGQVIFMIHPRFGSSECYQGLADKITNYVCYGVNSYNLYHENKITDIYKLAEYYLVQIKKTSMDISIKYNNNNFQFNFLGWSLGGELALIIAYLLENEGIKNIAVLLLDASKKYNLETMHLKNTHIILLKAMLKHRFIHAKAFSKLMRLDYNGFDTIVNPDKITVIKLDSYSHMSIIYAYDPIINAIKKFFKCGYATLNQN